jgi:hypothetical protein
MPSFKSSEEPHQSPTCRGRHSFSSRSNRANGGRRTIKPAARIVMIFPRTCARVKMEIQQNARICKATRSGSGSVLADQEHVRTRLTNEAILEASVLNPQKVKSPPMKMLNRYLAPSSLWFSARAKRRTRKRRTPKEVRRKGEVLRAGPLGRLASAHQLLGRG